jgi:hypothetical protein
VKRLMFGIVWSPFIFVTSVFASLLVDQESGHAFQECPEELIGLRWQLSFGHGLIHQLHPPISCILVDSERKVPGAKSWMPALLDIPLRAAEPINQKIPQTLFGGNKVVGWIHRAQDIIFRHTPVEG